MSAELPGCDSDEEAFWGPVTAKEIELTWRYRKDIKNEAERLNVHSECNKNQLDIDLKSSEQIPDAVINNIENIPPEELNGLGGERKLKLSGNSEQSENRNLSITAKSNDLKNENVLQEIQAEYQADSLASSISDQYERNASTNTVNICDSSDEKSFVSLQNEEENVFLSSEEQFVPVHQDDFLPSNNSPPLKGKENDAPCSKSDRTRHISKLPVLKPATLEYKPDSDNEKWAKDLKRKKIPNSKKPNYMVSPAKLDNILKNRCQSKPLTNKPPSSSGTTQNPKVKPLGQNSKTETKKIFTPTKKQFGHIQSPISQYIRSGACISPSKSLPVLRTPNKIPVPVSMKSATPVSKLMPKFYSSAEKLIIKPGPSSIPRPGEKAKMNFISPKIFKHQGRITDEKKPGEINVVTPRAVRSANLQETSFACLAQSLKQLDVSVIEEQ